MKKIFITDYIQNPDLEKKILQNEAEIICLNETDENKFPKEIINADGLLVWHAKISEITLKKLKKNTAIIRYGVGIDNIDLKSVKKYGVTFANTPDYGVSEVADTSCALILNLIRKIHLYNNKTKLSFGKWQKEVVNINQDLPVIRTSEHKLGIIGLGRIGSSLALRMKNFDMQVGFYDPYVGSGYEKVLGIKKYETLDELKSNSSIISINATLNSETKKMVNEKFINSLNNNTILINTARGAIVENLDIILDGLKKNKLSAVGLDVLPEEPPKENEDLIKVWRNSQDKLSERIIINPHAGYYSTTSIKEMRTKASSNMLSFLKGEKVKNIVEYK
tara:strand:+ start:2414 stop:3418 length:1005 start_codon:yes stop_codon:yes gene_type:complete